jgi:hypothetical protein
MKQLRDLWAGFSEFGAAHSTGFGRGGAGADVPSASDMHEGLLRLVLRDTLRLTGIPTDWIRGKVARGRDANGRCGLEWRLWVCQWDDELVQLLPLIERRLRVELALYEPDAGQWLLGISWQFHLDRYPRRVFPSPDHWKAVQLRKAGVQDDPMDALLVRELPAPTTQGGQQKLAEWMAAGPAPTDWADGLPPFRDFQPTERN